MNAPLAGIRVVEVASYVAVPAAGALLADLGAEVVKVEVPHGEIYRHGRPSFSGYATDFPESPPFQMDNKGKLSVALDLKRPQAREALGRMIGEVDETTATTLQQTVSEQSSHIDQLEALRRELQASRGDIAG